MGTSIGQIIIVALIAFLIFGDLPKLLNRFNSKSKKLKSLKEKKGKV